MLAIMFVWDAPDMVVSTMPFTHTHKDKPVQIVIIYKENAFI